MIISQETIQSIQNIVRIEEVVADFISLKKKGQNFWACCPFHQEHTPSFSVSAAKGFYKCFGCDAAGDAITFVQQIEGCSFVEAIGYLAQKYGIAVVSMGVEKQVEELQRSSTEEHLYFLLNLAQDYYSNLLWNHPEAARVALPYLNQRAISSVCAKKFSLGYSLASWNGFYRFAVDQGIAVDSLVSAGLVIKKDAKIYDRFRGRLMFPIHNSRGQVVAFGARELSTADGPKYINSPETLVYRKREFLYGFSLAKQYIKQENNCYLVEGYTDVLAFHQIDKQAVVSISGTSLMVEQMDALRRLTTRVTLVFDGDCAGVQASFRGIDPLLAKGFEVKVVVLPSGMDPDSYIRKVGKATVVHYIEHTVQDFITFKAGVLLNQTAQNSPVEQAKGIRAILQSIIAIPDSLERRLFLKKCSTLFVIEEEILRSIYHELCNTPKAIPFAGPKKPFNQRQGKQQRSVAAPKQLSLTHKLTTSIEAYEREIVRILLMYGTMALAEGQRLYEYIFLELGDIAFQHDACQQLLNYCKEAFLRSCLVDLPYILREADASIKKIAIDLTAYPHALSEAWVKKYGIHTMDEAQHVHQLSIEVILRLKMRLVQRLMEKNREGLQKECSLEEEVHLLQVHQMLKATECSLANRLGVVVA